MITSKTFHALWRLIWIPFSDACETVFGEGLRIVSGTDNRLHLIEAAPFGCLDQMLRTIVQGGLLEGFAPPADNRGGCPRPKTEKNWNYLDFFRKKFEKIHFAI